MGVLTCAWRGRGRFWFCTAGIPARLSEQRHRGTAGPVWYWRRILRHHPVSSSLRSEERNAGLCAGFTWALDWRHLALRDAARGLPGAISSFLSGRRSDGAVHLMAGRLLDGLAAQAQEGRDAAALEIMHDTGAMGVAAPIPGVGQVGALSAAPDAHPLVLAILAQPSGRPRSDRLPPQCLRCPRWLQGAVHGDAAFDRHPDADRRSVVVGLVGAGWMAPWAAAL